MMMMTKIDTIDGIKWYCDISLDPEFGGTIGTGPNVSVDTLRISGITFDDQGILTNPKEINLVIAAYGI